MRTATYLLVVIATCAFLAGPARASQDSIPSVIPPVQHLIERWEGGESIIRIPFARHPIIRLGRDNRIYYGWTENLEIEAYSLEGELLQTIRLPSHPIALTDAEWKEAIEERGGGGFGARKCKP